MSRFSRRDFLKGALVVSGTVIAGTIGARFYRNQIGRDYDQPRTEVLLENILPAENPDKLPNIVLIVADDLGYGDLSAYGSKVIKTPNIDHMADQGVQMNNFYACASVCTPSRAALLTGRYPKRSHMTVPLYPSNHPMEYFLKLVNRYQYDVTGIPEDEATLAEILGKFGYRTGLIGKWHLGDQLGHLPNDNGFDDFYGVLYANDSPRFKVWRNDVIEIPEPVDQSLLTQNYTREALRFLQTNSNQPFFLYLSHTAVHEPIFASPEFTGVSAGGLYGDSVQEIDWSLGQIMDKLSESGLENTLVIFTSDNGPWWQGDPGGLRGRKNNIAEGGLRVPFIAHWLGHIPTGRVSNALCVNFDIFPTCLSIAGIPIPKDRVIDGKNMLPVLTGDADSIHERFFYYDGPILVAVRYQNWKYQRRHMSDNGGYPLFSQGPFLFDLVKDPDESYNLIETYPEVAQKLAKMLAEWETEMKANLRGWL